MNDDVYDKLTVDVTYKFTHPELKINDIKASMTPQSVYSLTKQRISLPPTPTGSCDSIQFSADQLPKPSATQEIVIMVLKLAAIPSNKGLQGTQVSAASFKSVDPASNAQKIEGDGTAVFWNTDTDAYQAPQDGKFWYYNPNKSNAVVDVLIGFADKQTSKAKPADTGKRGNAGAA